MMYAYRANSFIFIVKFTPDIVSQNELYLYRVNSFMLMTRFTLNIVSGIELPAMYKVNTFNLTAVLVTINVYITTILIVALHCSYYEAHLKGLNLQCCIMKI